MTDRDNLARPTSVADDQVDPDELMGDINRLSFFKVAGISVLIHLVLIGATSVGYVMLCAEYQTLYPDREIQRIAKEDREKELRADREAAHKKLIAEQKAKTASSKGGRAGGGANGGGGKTPVERNINRKATTLPTRSGIGLDDIGEID